jgi:hypothetical protein
MCQTLPVYMRAYLLFFFFGVGSVEKGNRQQRYH